MIRLEREWAAVVLSSFVGASESFTVRAGEVDYLSAMTRFMGAASEKACLGLRIAVVLAMTAPFWMLGRLRSLASFTPEERSRLLDEMTRHPVYFVRELCMLLKLVACMAIFRDGDPRARTDYDRPVRSLVVLQSRAA